MQREPVGHSSELSARVGHRITALRGARGLSLSALARMSGLSKSTLSDLERGRRTATLDSLFAITTALTAPLSDLLIDEGAGTPQAADAQDTVRGTAVTADLVDRFSTDTHTVEIFRIHIGRDTQTSEPHSAGVQEILTVISGSARVGPRSKPILLQRSETAHYPADVVHTYRSADGAVAILTMLYPS